MPHVALLTNTLTSSSLSLPSHTPPPHTHQVMVDVTGEEFETLMDVLSKLQYLTTEEGSKEIMTLISDQAELASDFQVRDRGTFPHLLV